MKWFSDSKTSFAHKAERGSHVTGKWHKKINKDKCFVIISGGEI